MAGIRTPKQLLASSVGTKVHLTMLGAAGMALGLPYPRKVRY
jgi:hypothetical protein